MAARKTPAPPPVAAEDEPQVIPEPDTPDEPAEDVEEPQERTAAETAYIDALRRELEGYTRYDREDQADGVKAELDRLGVSWRSW